MKINWKDIDKKWKVYALAGCVCVLFYLCLTHLDVFWNIIAGLFNVLKPVILGFIMAYIINPVCVWCYDKIFKNVNKESLRWTLAVIVALIFVLLLITVLIALLIPQIIQNILSLANNYSVYVGQLRDFLVSIKDKIGDADIINNIIRSLSDGGLIAQLGSLLGDNAQSIIEKTTGIGTQAVNWGIGAIFAIYFLLAKKSILDEFAKAFSLILSPLKYEKATILLGKFNAIFSKYIVCELVDSAIVGVANYIFMIICGMPDAIFISFIVAITNLAPTFGPLVGAVIGAFILLLLKPAAIIPFLIFTVVLQTLDGYVIKPKLFGGALNVPGVLILIAIIVFGKLMGVTGMLLAIPFAAIIVYLYTEVFIPWLELKRDLKRYNKELSKD